MSIKRITFSGVDEGIKPKWLAEVTSEYSHLINIEWGILLSPKNGRERYPSQEWIDKTFKVGRTKELFLAGHLCGRYAKDFITGNRHKIPIDLDLFDRIQINLAPYIDTISPESIYESIKQNELKYSTYIVQAGTNLSRSIEIAEYLKKRLISTNILFDCSGGQGIETNNWPKPVNGFICGYAGGLGPHNLREKLEQIHVAAEQEIFWIDIESGIRTDDKIDQNKIVEALEIARLF